MVYWFIVEKRFTKDCTLNYGTYALDNSDRSIAIAL